MCLKASRTATHMALGVNQPLKPFHAENDKDIENKLSNSRVQNYNETGMISLESLSRLLGR